MPVTEGSIGHAATGALDPSPARNLASALPRLRAIADMVEGANERSQQFLDALVGQSREGQDAATGAPIGHASFVGELHRIIDRLERAATAANSRSFDLLAAADDGQSVGARSATAIMNSQYVGRLNDERIAQASAGRSPEGGLLGLGSFGSAGVIRKPNPDHKIG